MVGNWCHILAAIAPTGQGRGRQSDAKTVKRAPSRRRKGFSEGGWTDKLPAEPRCHDASGPRHRGVKPRVAAAEARRANEATTRMDPSRREYPRAAADVRVSYLAESVTSGTREYLEGLAADIGIGGMFIATDHPLPKGSVASLEFRTGVDAKGVRARAMVRWVRRIGNPKGMGIEFIEFDGLGDVGLEKWIERLTG